MAFLALLSLLATFVPSLAWACPVTGHVGTAFEVCASSAPLRRSGVEEMACCSKKRAGAFMGRCCRAVVSPHASLTAATLAGPTENRVAPTAASLVSPLEGVTHAPRLVSAAVITPPPSALQGREVVRLHSQHAFSLRSGRAPPMARD